MIVSEESNFAPTVAKLEDLGWKIREPFNNNIIITQDFFSTKPDENFNYRVSVIVWSKDVETAFLTIARKSQARANQRKTGDLSGTPAPDPDRERSRFRRESNDAQTPRQRQVTAVIKHKLSLLNAKHPKPADMTLDQETQYKKELEQLIRENQSFVVGSHENFDTGMEAPMTTSREANGSPEIETDS
jgi:hypothetical protein